MWSRALEFFLDINYTDIRESHIQRIAEFRNYGGRKVLEVGFDVGVWCWNRFDAVCEMEHGSCWYRYSKRSVACARKGLRLFELADETVVADSENLPFRDGAFDHVYSYGVLYHTPNTKNAINEI